jgi:hypothetical protein
MLDALRAKRLSVRFVLALAPALMLMTANVFACDHAKESKAATADTQHQEHQPLPAEPNAAIKRFPTDKHLRKSMSSIEEALANATGGQIPSKKSANELGKMVEEGIADIVKHCSLPKDADAALHPIIHEMSLAAAQLKSGQNVESALQQLGQSLSKYRETFDHPLEAAAHVH